MIRLKVGFVLMLLGASAMDSKSLAIPLILLAIGTLMLITSQLSEPEEDTNEEEELPRRDCPSY